MFRFEGERFAELGSLEIFEQIVDALDILELREGANSNFLLTCFDEVFHRVISRLAGIGYRSGDTSAALAAHLSAPFNHVSEYFTTTGEFAVMRRPFVDVTRYAMQVTVFSEIDFFVGLRFALHDIRATVEQSTRTWEPLESEFVLIDHPLRNPAGAKQPGPFRSAPHNSLEILDEIVSRAQMGLAVVPGADRSAQGWRGKVRRRLVESNRLLAVIDLPKERIGGSTKQASAWVIGDGRNPVSHVLMVDANRLTGQADFRVPGGVMAFAATLVSQGLFGSWPPISRPASLDGAMDDARLTHEPFSTEGYRDVDGLCRRVGVEEVEDKAYKLVASSYLEGAGGTKNSQKSISLLNSEPVLKALLGARRQSTRIYVIGNNGQGKSILLADLADRLVDDGTRVVGISFGLTDRFTFGRPKHNEQLFIYAGARTSSHNISLPRTSAEVTGLLRAVHIDPKRLEVFSAIVGLLGFGARRYLVPPGIATGPDHDRRHYAELLQLSDNAEKNSAILAQADLSRYELGLMRQESVSSITTFGELSSGEQQLLGLALKVIAHAEEGTVILVDEPELSLHVSWQRAIPALLEMVGSRIGCSIVVATHSPVIIASASHRADRCFAARRHALKELSWRERRSVETALFDGFQTYTANNRQVHERCAAIVSKTIQLLNSESINDEDDLLLGPVLNELETMERIIRMADALPPSDAKEDLELVAHTRAAIDELARVGRRNRR
jgi:predicted ATPase